MSEPAESAGVTDFDRTTRLVPIDTGPGRFLVDLDGGWLALSGVHGGYMSALSARAVETMAPDRVVRTMSTSFLRPGRVGPAMVSARQVRQGRSMTTMITDLVQDEQILTTSRMTLMTPRNGLEWSEPRPSDLPPPADCVPFSPAGGVVSFGRIELRLAPDWAPDTGGRAHVGGYVRPLEARPIDAAWLVMAVDSFPPSAFARTPPPTGGMSIDLTVHIHRSGFLLADDAWLVGSFAIDDSTGGLAVEHGRLTKMDGTVVAEAFHTRLTAQS